MKRLKIAICVCTYQRPKMLTRCFMSLINLECLENWDIIFVIVDNETAPNNQALIEGFQDNTHYPVYYAHEPQRGISAARNRALEEALKYQADWITFFDDDQYVDKNALVAAYQTSQKFKADVVSMLVKYVLDENIPGNIGENVINDLKRVEVRLMNKCATGGVFFHHSLVSANQYNLRFDQSFRLRMGGDIDFFFRANQLGVKIVESSNAIAYENVVQDRMTLRYQLHRNYCLGLSKFQFTCRYQKSKLLFRILKKIIKLSKILEILLWPIYLLKGRLFLKKKALKLSVELSNALGFLTGFLKININIYAKKTAGY